MHAFAERKGDEKNMEKSSQMESVDVPPCDMDQANLAHQRDRYAKIDDSKSKKVKNVQWLFFLMAL